MANSDALKDVRRRLGRRVRRTGGWIGLVHGPSDDRTRIFGWLAQVASSFDGDRTPNNNEELLMAMNLLDEVFCKTACESAVQASGVTGVTHPCITGLLTPASSPCSPLHQRCQRARVADAMQCPDCPR